MIPRLDQVVMNWTDDLDVILTVTVIPRGRARDGEEWRLAQAIAAAIWASWHLSELEAPTEE
jgi:hypothetical protein